MSDRRFRALQEVAGPVSRETFERLLAFERIFLRWAKRINLAAPSTLDAIWERHILDSAQLVRLAPKARRWLDLGSGGGFPGAVLAILMAEKGEAAVDLVESNRKKVAFLRASLGELGVAATVHARRIEECHVVIPAPDVVTARALAPLGSLLALAEPWLSRGARGLFHKGRDYRREISETGNFWTFDLVEHADMVDPEGIILDVVNLGRRDRSAA